ncbi:Cadherin-1 [Dissostichus eleginoides]|uniref:Cadherin-1 n=1 Tax=Dissostichus eleginoides TaxID=100907 RepID=A0AAD9CM26_DISEL|nr:Cadherin-1 [Dissostichus eleginoides]
MGTAQFAVLGILIAVFQASVLVPAEEPTCVPGFKSSRFIFKVSTKRLKPHTRLGKVAFTDCTDRTIFVFKSDDRHFTVQRDGILKVKELIHIRGNQDFFVHTWTSQGHKISVPSVADQPVPILHFRKASAGLRRRKRDWVIPVISVSENIRGPFPLKVSQIRSNEDEELIRILLACSPWTETLALLYLTQPLDREQKSVYKFLAHAVADGGGTGEEPMEINVKVIDQNDNRPVFSQDTYLGEVAESSAKGLENYRPGAKIARRQMFEINPNNGSIRVNAGGLDREKYPKQQRQRSDLHSAIECRRSAVPILHFRKASAGLRRRKRDWVIPVISVSENIRGPFPLKVSQIRSNEDEVKIYYSVTGPGADQDPVGLFTMDRDSGTLYLTQPLDREQKSVYKFLAHAVADGGGTGEEPMEINVKVIDQNDNRPVFSQDTYLGEVAESSAKGLEVIKVVATDADEENSDNSDIVYRIIDQEPKLPADQMFEINPNNGSIRVNAGGLDRESVADQPVPILHFRKASAGLRRRKRDWVIPVISVSENIRGPFPLKVSQDKVKKIYYSITGPGADQDPVGLFTMDRDSGILYLTQPLDREQKSVYKNDNRPVFSQDTYLGEVAESSAKGLEVIKVVATDADEENSDNSDIVYRIIDQEPKLPADQMFEINPNNGFIRVNAGGLDREKYPKYTLVVQASDMRGEGLNEETKVILTVTDSNDNAPIFTQPLILGTRV